MSQQQSNRIRYTFSKRYKWVGTLSLILLLGLTLYFLLPQIFPAALQPAELPLPPTPAKGVFLQDDFSNPGSGWPSDSQAHPRYGYQPPSFYYLEAVGPNETVTVFRGLDLHDVTIEARVIVNYTATPNGDFRMGLVVRRLGDNYYGFTISPRSQRWQVFKHTSAGVEVLAEDKYHSTRAIFRLFTLSVTAQAANLSFRINGQPLISLSDADFAGGDVGFIVETLDETLAHVIYDSLTVWDREGEIAADFPAVEISPTPASQLSSTPTAASSPLLPTLTPRPPAGTSVLPTATPMPPPTATALPPPPTPTLSPSPTVTRLPASSTPSPSPAPTLTPSSTATLQPPTPTLSPTPTSAVSPVPPTPTASITPTPTASLPVGTFVLLSPLDMDQPTFGPTDFEWEWTGPVPPGTGFEVRVWREGEATAGVHDAVQDNQNGIIRSVGQNRYVLHADIKDAAGVRGRRGEYFWTVALVQISPAYTDLGQQATPARLRFETPGGDGQGGGDNGGGGGGVGID